MVSPSFIIPHLLSQAPLLLVYLTAIVLSLAWRERCPLAATFVLFGSALAVALTIAWGFTVQWALDTGGVQSLQVWSFAMNVLHAVNHALLIAAAFVGRRAAYEPHFPVIVREGEGPDQMPPDEGAGENQW